MAQTTATDVFICQGCRAQFIGAYVRHYIQGVGPFCYRCVGDVHCAECGETDSDTHACAACGKTCCYDCIEWCHAPGDPPNGDWFCEDCRESEP